MSHGQTHTHTQVNVFSIYKRETEFLILMNSTHFYRATENHIYDSIIYINMQSTHRTSKDTIKAAPSLQNASNGRYIYLGSADSPHLSDANISRTFIEYDRRIYKTIQIL